MQFYVAHLLKVSRSIPLIAGLLALIITAGCGSPSSNMTTQQSAPTVEQAAANVAAGGSTPRVLLFIGTGTTAGSDNGWKTILGNMKVTYATATSSQLNAMSASALSAYKMLLIPGGDAITISRSLTATTKTKIKTAVTNGMHYLGICAGAFIAGHSGVYSYFDFTPAGVWFNFYADYFKGITKAAVEIAYPGGSKLDQYWERGPQLTGWGQVAGKYPDGTPAIVEGKIGSGWVILCAVHPEATAAWRTGMKFATSVATDNAYANTLVTNALNGTSLPHY
jgi:glutamine amidotransferase PdxT